MSSIALLFTIFACTNPAGSIGCSEGFFVCTEPRRAEANDPSCVVLLKKNALPDDPWFVVRWLFYSAAPPLCDCSPCSWLDVMLSPLSTRSCSRFGCSGCSLSPDILGDGDHPSTTGSGEAACSGPRYGESVGNCSIVSGHF
jgi:hypothetical protein